MKAKHLLQSHTTIMDYAKRRQVFPARVYEAINAGYIKIDLIGLVGITMIDLKKYGTYQFNGKKVSKQAVDKWFERKGKKKQ
jgi:hypothetical protein